MICYAEQDIQLRPAEGNSGVSPFCVATSAGFLLEIIVVRLKCSACKLMKLENEFSRDRYTKIKGKGTRSALYGRSYDCLSCIRIKRKKTHERNPQIAIRRNAKRRKLYKDNPEEKQKQRFAMLKTRYNLTIEQYDTLLKSQNGGCAICGKNNNPNHLTGKVLHVDHNHLTGIVRGLLCLRCNTVIGLCKENPDILKKVSEYIYRHME